MSQRIRTSLLSCSRRFISGGKSQSAQISETVSASAANPIPFASTDAADKDSAPVNSKFVFDDRYPVRNDWAREEIRSVYNKPLLELVYHGATAHRIYFDPRQVQRCTLLSIKTGGCPEDCKYCSQSSKYDTGVKAERLMEFEAVLKKANEAKEAGSTRFCMGAAWRGVSQVGPRQFGRVLNMVSEIRGMGMEVCATLGLLNKEQAVALKEAGLTAYNHNLDTSKEYYANVITSRAYGDRLKTLENVREAGISVCCGGIIGLGEKHEDRVSLLHTLSTMPEHPESVPVNALVANEGTPLEKAKPVGVWDLCRMIATARVVMPRSMVRLSAGRVSLSQAEQALCFMAGANSIFTGDKLLTTPNPEFDSDDSMMQTLGLVGKPPFFYEEAYEKRQA
ncbi:Biotin synthase [Gracilariopsis chorda]|uniref:biotin synthase n=1 Tax=Gracilariopsis chorda TaxID=448386 RepID=A0A2V3IW57_9FLOR|nr:Biotin synthase [Gracilariopsis chorda]|eukprot:PXF46319.1 Biotin synthase [Gracilariopsis chorda]